MDCNQIRPINVLKMPHLLMTVNGVTGVKESQKLNLFCDTGLWSQISSDGCAPHLEVVHYSDVFWRPGALGMVHHRVFLQTRNTTGGQHLIVLVHTQGLPSQIFNWDGLTATHTSYAIKQQQVL